jgi:hypothetical protein
VVEALLVHLEISHTHVLDFLQVLMVESQHEVEGKIMDLKPV